MDASIHQQRLRALFAERDEVVLAYLFGSRARGHAGPRSDYDIGVLADRACMSAPAKIRARLAHEVVGTIGADVVDIVLLDRASTELAYHVIAQGHLLYHRSRTAQVEYEAYVLGRYGDYLPVLRRQRQQIIENTSHAHRVQRYRTALGRIERTFGAFGAPSREDA